jgi:hypothetical protein
VITIFTEDDFDLNVNTSEPDISDFMPGRLYIYVNTGYAVALLGGNLSILKISGINDIKFMILLGNYFGFSVVNDSFRRYNLKTNPCSTVLQNPPNTPHSFNYGPSPVAHNCNCDSWNLLNFGHKCGLEKK